MYVLARVKFDVKFYLARPQARTPSQMGVCEKKYVWVCVLAHVNIYVIFDLARL